MLLRRYQRTICAGVAGLGAGPGWVRGRAETLAASATNACYSLYRYPDHTGTRTMQKAFRVPYGIRAD